MTPSSQSTAWNTARLEELVSEDRPITYGIVKPGPDTEHGIPYIRVVDMDGGGVRVDALRRTSPEIAKQYRRSEVQPGDLLLSIRGHVGRLAVVPEELAGANITQDTARLVLRRGCHPRYVFWYLHSLEAQRWMERQMKGVAVRGINLADVKEIPVPVPPLPEQRRIAAILDKADAIRRKRQEAIQLTEHLLPAAFQELFGESEGESAYPSKRLDALAEVVSGVTLGRKFNGQRTIQLPYLRVANVQAGYLDLSEIKTVEALPGDLEKRRLRPGDVLLTEGGDFDKLGRGALWEGQVDDCIHQNHIFRVRVDPRALMPVFFVNYLQTVFAKSYFLRCAKKTTNLASINMTQLRGLPVPLPPLSLQRQFVKHAIKIKATEGKQTATLREADHLFDSLVQRAFRGEF